jgi:hypothetical protein
MRKSPSGVKLRPGKTRGRMPFPPPGQPQRPMVPISTSGLPGFKARAAGNCCGLQISIYALPWLAAMRFGHPVWQVAGAEQSGFEYFLRDRVPGRPVRRRGRPGSRPRFPADQGRTTHWSLPAAGAGSWVWRRGLAVVMRPGGPAGPRRWRTRWRRTGASRRSRARAGGRGRSGGR